MQTESVIDKIPIINIDKESIENLPEASIQNKVDFMNDINKITCNESEQYDNLTNKCYPCSYYTLEWDSEYKKCRIKEKDNIKNIFVDVDDNVIGYNSF